MLPAFSPPIPVGPAGPEQVLIHFLEHHVLTHTNPQAELKASDGETTGTEDQNKRLFAVFGLGAPIETFLSISNADYPWSSSLKICERHLRKRSLSDLSPNTISPTAMSLLRLLSRPALSMSSRSTMAAPRSSLQVVRHHSTESSYTNILISSPRPGVGLSMSPSKR